MKTFGEFNERLIALCEEFGVRYNGGWGSFESNDAAGIEIIVDAMERWEPKVSGSPPFQPEWTEEEVAAGIAAAEEFAETEETERSARIERLKRMTPDEREAAYWSRQGELVELYGWNRQRLTVVDLSALSHDHATIAYLDVMGEDVEIIGYDDGAEKAREFARAGMPVGRVAIPRHRGSVTNSPDGEPLP